MSKVSDKTFFRCEMLWTALTEIATRYSTTSRVPPYISFVPKPLLACFTTEQSTAKASLFVNQNVQEWYEIYQNVAWAWFYQWSLNPTLYSLSFTLYSFN